MINHHPMMWQFITAKRLRWWMNLPFRPLIVFTYPAEWVWKFLDWYEWKIVNRAIIWYANRNCPKVWKAANKAWYTEGFEAEMKEIFDVSTRKASEGTPQDDTARTGAASEETK